ncbi:MAG: 3-isopropylmalate dehydratase large subunit [Burkholderiales bacterium]|nr:3-isopropylmalate dehydratase large subunit [Burkholderiales bacterium]
MPETLFDRIWKRHIVSAFDADEALLYIDRVLLHEGSNHAFRSLEAMRRRARRPRNAIACSDHYVPTVGRERGLEGVSIPENRAEIASMQSSAREQGLVLFAIDDPQQGILHVVAPELGITLPGMCIVGGDSHTCTHGAFGAIAFGTGSSELAHILATQTLWQTRPKRMRIAIEGRLGEGVSAKDLALSVVGAIGNDGGIGYFIEYAGACVRALSMEQRMTLCNLAIEAGARGGMVAPDDTLFEYLAAKPYAPSGAAWDRALAHWRTLASDAGAHFDRDVALDASRVVPQVTWGTNPSQVVAVDGVVPDPAAEPDPMRRESMKVALDYMDLKPGMSLSDLAFDRVFIGSCTNGRIEDLRAAAAVARRGRAVLPACVVPGSRTVKRQAEAEGLDRVFREAGFEWRDSGCSFCTCINGDVVPPGERCASTANRNYKGRQGPGSRTHLVSPATAAAAALTGHVVDVRRFATT